MISVLMRRVGIESKDENGIVYFYPTGQMLPGNVNPHISTPPTKILPAVLLRKDSTDSVAAPSAPTAVPVEKPEPDIVRLYRPRYRTVDQLQVIVNQFTGKQYKDSDNVVIAGDEKGIERVMKLIADYDHRPAEILAKAVIFEFSDSETKARSFDFVLSLLAGKLGVTLGGGVQSLANAVQLKTSTINAILSAVEKDSRFRLISSPSVRVRHASSARFVVGTREPVLAESTLDRNGNPIQSIRYMDSGVIFDLKPQILEDRIELELSQQISSFSKTSTSTINSPSILTREIKTTLNVEPDELVIIGGLDEDKKSTTKSGLSFLPSILDSTSGEKTHSQILLVLQITKL